MIPARNQAWPVGRIWTLNLDEPTPAITPLIAATFGPAGAEAGRVLAAAMGGETRSILERFETGRRCYAAWVEGQLAAYGWVSFDQEFIGELSLRLRLLPGEVYIWDCATLPAFRRRRLYSALLVYMLGALRTEPLCRAWIGADLDNDASQRGIARAGFRPVADLVMARVSARRRVWVEGRPGVSPGLIAEARRAFLDGRDQAWLAARPPAKHG
jgi:ribosomal protein S18 acetylase RimI-like enzyme